jgi:hypothetical protein
MQTPLQVLRNGKAALYSTSHVSRGHGKAKLTFFVKKETDPTPAYIEGISRSKPVGALINVIKAKFPSLKDIDPSCIVLRKLQTDGSLSDLPDSMMTVEQAGLGDKDQLIVKVTSSAPSIAGEVIIFQFLSLFICLYFNCSFDYHLCPVLPSLIAMQGALCCRVNENSLSTARLYQRMYHAASSSLQTSLILRSWWYRAHFLCCMGIAVLVKRRLPATC